MQVLITANNHPFYDKTGEVVGKSGNAYQVHIPHAEGQLRTVVSEGEFKEIKRQVESTPDPAGTLSSDGRYQADGLGCVERVSSVERDWLDPAAHNPRGY